MENVQLCLVEVWANAFIPCSHSVFSGGSVNYILIYLLSIFSASIFTHT